MPSIATLLDTLPPVRDVTVSSEGYVLWLSWQGDPGSTVAQTLQDYGGLCVASDTDQALWFFFSPDALLALAKLAVWGKFNPLSMTVLAMPGSLRVGVGQTLALALDKKLARQELEAPSAELTVWIHPRLCEMGANIPGLAFTTAEGTGGMARVKWGLLVADARLPYASSQGWYALLRPLGNPLDKAFQTGWRYLFERLEEILQAQKLKYSLYDNVLMLPLDNLSVLRVWIRELLLTLDDIRERDFASYWPCLSAVVDRRGLNFNNELPQKVNIQWDELMPDYPYMSYRNAYLLGEGFSIQDLHFSSQSTSMDNWCTVNLTELQARSGSLPLLMAGQLVTGGQPCFYCGVPTHEASQCPSRRLPPVPADFWHQYFDLDLNVINAAYRNIDAKLSSTGGAGCQTLLEQGGPEARVLEGLFAIHHDIQLRSVERIWKLSGKDMDAEVSEADSAHEESPAWAMVERLQRAGPNELNGLEKEIGASLARTPRDWRLHSLMGFVALERGDLAKAQTCWHNAENLCSSVLHQAWHCFLQGRALELRGKLIEAMEQFGTAGRLLPQWKSPGYRVLVCRVKMGFAEQTRADFDGMIDADPSRFNIILLDPELERGRKTALTSLYPLWLDARKRCNAEKNEVERLIRQLAEWFPPEHEASSALGARLASLQATADVQNYLSFLNILVSRPAVEAEIDQLIQEEIESLQKKFKRYLASLEFIRDEASWFPFQRALVEFNRDFNNGASMLNWAFTADFHQPEAFRKAQSYLAPLDEILERLVKRLRLLRMVRDTTLFVLLLIRTFFWMEIICLVLCFVVVMGILFWGDSMGMVWLQRIIRANFWSLQKVLVTIISLTALGVAALRTTLIFEKRRDAMLEEAREQREAMQNARLERARARREEMLRRQRTQDDPFAMPARKKNTDEEDEDD